MSFEKGFDEILNQLLIDYHAQNPEIDTSKGSLAFIKSACTASALYGIYSYQQWISKQIFPDKASIEFLEKWAWLYAVDVVEKSPSEIVTEILDRIQNPPAGGTEADYERWARSITNVKAAYCYPLAMGLGTVVMLIVANETLTGSEVPAYHNDITGTNDSVVANALADSTAAFVTDGVRTGAFVQNDTTGTIARVTAVDSETQLSLDADIFTTTGKSYTVRSMIEEIRLYVESVQPIIAGAALSVIVPSINTQDVTMTVTGADADKTQTALDIEAYMDGLAPDETLRLSKITAIAINNGAEDVNITAPAADVIPANYEMIRPGTINVG